MTDNAEIRRPANPDAEHPRPQPCLSGIRLVQFSLRYVKEKKNILTLEKDGKEGFIQGALHWGFAAGERGWAQL